MPADEHLSIGEVLALIQAEFPDVTISKIRFLESQGLIQPERTASGYRKFYDADIARLRWVLLQQRDHFLPLKVIKARLEAGANVDGHGDPVEDEPTLFSSQPSAAPPETNHPSRRGSYPRRREGGSFPRRRPSDLEPAGEEAQMSGTSDAGRGEVDGAGEVESVPAEVPVVEAAGTHSGASSEAEAEAAVEELVSESGERLVIEQVTIEHTEITLDAGDGAELVVAVTDTERSRRVTDLQEAPEAVIEAATVPVSAPERTHQGDTVDESLPETSDLATVEFCRAAGIPASLLAELERFGLIESRTVGADKRYDAVSLGIARLASRYAALGIEPRHLRMYKVAAEREAGFLDQVVLPVRKGRNPEEADELLAELVGLGTELQRRLLRRALG